MKRILSILLSLILVSCNNQPKPLNTLRVAISTEPTTLDPRKLRDLSGVTFVHQFFEGLTRLNEKGEPELALAKEVTISPDRKTYTFVLREAQWSNGDPVTAFDFEKTWKQNITPATLSPNAYQFFIIQGAKEASEGKIALDAVGITAKDASTLVVTLNQPVPYFMGLLAAFFYLPVHLDDYKINNGPFQLKEWKSLNEIVAVKNPQYWDKEKVKLAEINFILTDDTTALRLFENGELDWIGSPLGTIPLDAIRILKENENFHSQPAAATFFLRINTSQPPLNDINLRQALRDTLRREELVEHVLQGNQLPAYGIVPFLSSPYFKEEARSIQLPKTTITLMYSANERDTKIAQALQEQWRKNLGVDILLQSYERKMVFEKLKNLDYQIAIGGWYADIANPISFLGVLKEKSNGTNNTDWENDKYKQLLNESALVIDDDHRKQLFKEAEKILIEEAPIIPLFYNTHNYMHTPRVHEVILSEIGYLDFKNAYLEP